MRRQDFIAGLGVTALSELLRPFGARAQKQGRRHVGILTPSAPDEQVGKARQEAFERRLAQLGWQVGVNLEITSFWGVEKAHDMAATDAEVILGQSTPVVKSLSQATKTTPIVFIHVSDPVGSGIVASFARPDGNITGFTDIEPSLGSKWLELLKDIAPDISHAAMLHNPETAPGRGSFFLEPFDASARSLGVTIVPAAVHSARDIESALKDLALKPKGALAVMPESFVSGHRDQIIELARQYRLPAIYPYRFYTARGGLISYGTDSVDLFRRAAEYVDRILRGARANQLPVQAPTKFELVLNTKTAKILGLAFPQTLLARADEVIE